MTDETRDNIEFDDTLPQPSSSATEAIYREFRDRLFGFIRQKVPTEHDAEDILQDVFARIQASIDGVRETERTAAWIFRVASNAIADLYRAKARVMKHRESLGHHIARDESEFTADTSAEDALAQCMQPLVDQIPDEYSQAIAMTDLGGMTQRDAADRLGISLPAMKSRVLRGRTKIRDLLEACCAIETDRRGGIVSYRRREGGRQCGCGSDDSTCGEATDSADDECCDSC